MTMVTSEMHRISGPQHAVGGFLVDTIEGCAERANPTVGRMTVGTLKGVMAHVSK